MAAALFNAVADPTLGRGISAGTAPAANVHPEVVAAMSEVAIDLANVKPQRLTDELARRAQVLVTMGCGEHCPLVPGLRREDWTLRDPKGLPIEEVRVIRDEIRVRVARLARELGVLRSK
jgi:arsenate reductase